MFVNGELADMYKTDFLLAKEHNISLTEISNMVPFERLVYIGLVIEYLEKKQKELR
jgi:hypothetical protein